MISEHESTLEKILYFVGDKGTYQKLLYWFFLVPINIIIPWTALVPIFQSSIPDHWCYVPGRPEYIPLEQWKNMTIPREANETNIFSKCKQFTELTSFSISGNNLPEVTPCQNGWSFDTTWYDRTLPMSQNWVCDRDMLAAKWLSAGVAGNVVGTFIFNSISDHWGRKITIILTTQFYALFGTCRLFVTSDWALMVMMFLSSLPFPAILQISYIWVLEQVSHDLRAQMTSVACVMWTIGMCSVALLAWLSRDWVLLGIVTSLPFIPFILIWWGLPESPRWLVSKGRIEEAEKSFEKISKINRQKCPIDLHLALKTLVEVPETHKRTMLSYLHFTEFFVHSSLRKTTLLLVTVYTCNYLTYYILIYNTINVSGNEFLNFFFFSITELPSNLLGWLCSQYFGRRVTGVAFFLLTSLAAGTAAFLNSSTTWVMVFLVVTCKALVNVSYFVIYIQLAEIYPTSHRGTGIGLASITALILGVTVPYIAYTGSHWSSLPYIFLLIIALIGTIAALFLPETLAQSLPETITDAENFLKKQDFWSYKGKRPWVRKDTNNECGTLEE